MLRRFISQHQQLTVMQITGAILLFIGLLSLIGIVLYDFGNVPSPRENNVAAVGVFLIMMAIALLFPDMLKGSDKETTSAMRVAVFMVVSVFSILAVKVYWGCAVKDFNLNPNWAWLVGAALGSKAVQSLGENRAFTGGGGNDIPNKPPANQLFLGDKASNDLPLHDTSAVNHPPETPPAFLKPKNPRQ